MEIRKILFLVFCGTTLFKLSAQSNLDKLKTHIDGGQLLIYSESSYLSDNMASAITYIDFCPDGSYHYSYDGSFTVKGTQNSSNRDSRVNGAGVSKHQGSWKVMEHLNSYFLEITDNLGVKHYYPIIIQNLIAGKWKIGQTTYVFSSKSGNCH